jgi:hypothetical protein
MTGVDFQINLVADYIRQLTVQSKVVPTQSMKAYRGVDLQPLSVLNSALD